MNPSRSGYLIIGGLVSIAGLAVIAALLNGRTRERPSRWPRQSSSSASLTSILGFPSAAAPARAKRSSSRSCSKTTQKNSRCSY